MITRAAIERDVVITACAISAGIHAALTPDHLAEGAGAGAGFAIATVLLAAVAAELTRAVSTAALAGAAALFAGLLVSYGLAVTTVCAPPSARGSCRRARLVHQGRRGLGLLAAASLLSHRRPALVLNSPRPKGTLA